MIAPSDAVVIDLGSKNIRIGSTSSDKPTIIQTSLTPTVTEGGPTKWGSVPVHRGSITNLVQIAEIIKENSTKTPTSALVGRRVLTSHHFFTTRQEKEALTELIFEQFGAHSYYTANSGALGLFASGITDGIAIDLGYGGTQTVPILQGYSLPAAAMKMDIGGYDLDQYIQKMLDDASIVCRPDQRSLAVQEIKEQKCYIALDSVLEKKRFVSTRANHVQYQLPDRRIIAIGDAQFKCGEILFQPDLASRAYTGLPQLINSTVTRCGDLDLQYHMIQNLVLLGGTSLMKGLPERLSQELMKIMPPTTKLKLVAPADRVNSTWLGGAILASLTKFDTQWITKQKYEEAGPGVACTACL
jgi:actin beta/gamma 1